jgi:hypothetical protein
MRLVDRDDLEAQLVRSRIRQLPAVLREAEEDWRRWAFKKAYGRRPPSVGMLSKATSDVEMPLRFLNATEH